MGHRVLFVFGAESEIEIPLIVMEDRVITEAVVAFDFREDTALANPFEIEGFAVDVLQEADAAMVFGGAVLRVLHFLKNQPVDHRVVALADRLGVTGAIDAREMLSERFDFDSRIIGDHWPFDQAS